ncbi:site-2 protease family protein [Acaryochloris sp. CCMEE 5410]|uniref:site-2 protease family protein n=1 Tax=Acaryochloris sp. CCMEE 5410 TaxID=310037 RepID=UPI000248463D|nr:site-2 protease family protein [Acaryochloris sp. CCMEE 5410]KAI9132518.1 site-2 protease family protein [Acaryochloris sp. CCMEE 5410]
MQQGSNANRQVGAIFGIPLYVDPSWFLILALVTFANGVSWQQLYPNWLTGTAWIVGFVMALLLFVSVLLHELGHSLVARSQGIKVNSITLFLFGGIASIDEEAKTPEHAFQVAIAGPAVSISIFLILSLCGEFAAAESPARVLLQSLGEINLVLALFNLIPGLPLDGGQILKALVWKVTGNRLQGVRWAARVGQAFGWLAVIVGLAFTFLLGQVSGIWVTMLGWFGLRNAYNYEQFTQLQEALIQLQAQDAMTRDFRVVDAEKSLSQFADRYLLDTMRRSAYFAASEGRYRGIVDIDGLNTIERSQWEVQPIQSVVRSLQQIPTVRQDTPITEVIELLEEKQLPLITVLSPADAVAGVIDRGDTVKALAKKLNLPISDEDIRRIKDEGSYPSTLQLPAIARSVMADVMATEPTPETSSH